MDSNIFAGDECDKTQCIGHLGSASPLLLGNKANSRATPALRPASTAFKFNLIKKISSKNKVGSQGDSGSIVQVYTFQSSVEFTL